MGIFVCSGPPDGPALDLRGTNSKLKISTRIYFLCGSNFCYEFEPGSRPFLKRYPGQRLSPCSHSLRGKDRRHRGAMSELRRDFRKSFGFGVWTVSHATVHASVSHHGPLPYPSELSYLSAVWPSVRPIGYALLGYSTTLGATQG